MYALYEALVVGWNWFNNIIIIITLSSYAEYPFQSAFIKLKRYLKGIVGNTMTGWPLTQIRRCWVCGIRSMIYFLHLFAMLPGAHMRSGL